MRIQIVALWLLFVLAIGLDIYLRAQVEYMSYMTVWYEVEIAMYQAQNQELENQIVRQSSLLYTREKAIQLGYTHNDRHFIFIK